MALLNARAGVPSWGPELLARTHYALGTGMSTLDTMPDLYAQWERWAADVGVSHTTYLPLVRFRSPCAAVLLGDRTAGRAGLRRAVPGALPPDRAEVPARLCLRTGFLCFNRIARAMGFDIADEADAEAGISLTYGEFLEAVNRMREVDFPIEREPARGLAGVRRMAGQLRAGRLRDRRRRLRRAGQVVGSAPVRERGNPARPARMRPSAQVADPASRASAASPDIGIWDTSRSLPDELDLPDRYRPCLWRM